MSKLGENPLKVDKPKFSLMNWLFSSKSQTLESQITENIQLVKMLRRTHNELFDDYCDYVEEERKLQVSNTLRGKIFSFLAKILSLYCIYKVIMSLVNLILGRKGGLDPINKLMRLIVTIFNVNIDAQNIDIICSNMSFIIFGFLIIINVRSFAKNIIQCFKIIVKRYLADILSTDMVVYMLSEILGVYFVSTLLMMQNTFPYQFKQNINKVLGEINYTVLYNRFDTVFIVSSLVSMLVIWANLKIRESKWKNSDTLYEEAESLNV